MKRKDSEKLFAGLPLVAGEYIRLVIKKMGYRRKIRQDVQAEIAAHFEDALRDYNSEQERQQKSQKLIETFGDAGLLAVLLRRAKKRCRPLWKKILIHSLQAAAIIVLYLGICFAHLNIGRPNISVNYVDWLNKLVSQGNSENLNARPYFDKAVELWSPMFSEILQKSLHSWPGDMNEAQRQAVTKVLDENAKAIELLKEGVEKPYCWATYSSDVNESVKETLLQQTGGKMPGYEITAGIMDNVMKSLPGYRRVAYTLAMQAPWKAYNGDAAGALNDCLVLQKFGSHLQGKGLLIEQLVGIAIDALGLSKALMILEKVDVPADVLKNFQEEIEREDHRQAKVINLEAEKAFLYDYIQRSFTDDGKGNGHVLAKGLPLAIGDWKSSLWKFISFSYPDKREVVATIDEFFERGNQLFEETPRELHKAEQIDMWDNLGKRNFLLKMQGPAHRRVGEISWRLRTHRKSLIAVLAVLRYKKIKGEYPVSLDELVVEKYLKELPMDPWSDKPLGYRKTDGNFILYGVGENFIDDGGEVFRDDKGKVRQYADEGDWVFWPIIK